MDWKAMLKKHKTAIFLIGLALGLLSILLATIKSLFAYIYLIVIAMSLLMLLYALLASPKKLKNHIINLIQSKIVKFSYYLVHITMFVLIFIVIFTPSSLARPGNLEKGQEEIAGVINPETYLSPSSIEELWQVCSNTPNHNVTCWSPDDKEIPVYPSLEQAGMEKQSHASVKISDTIHILSIGQDKNTNRYIAYIQYGKNADDSHTGYVQLIQLIDLDKPNRRIDMRITNQTTRIYMRPDTEVKDEKKDIGPGNTVYLLGSSETSSGNWRQILYYARHGYWYIYWVKAEELEGGQTCTIKAKEAPVGEKPEEVKKETWVTYVYEGEVYTVWNTESATNGVDWYEIYAKGLHGWVCSKSAVKDDEQ